MRVLILSLLLVACRRSPPCPSWTDIPAPKECCESCTPYDAGCGLMVCRPDSGVRCGPCPVFN